MSRHKETNVTKKTDTEHWRLFRPSVLTLPEPLPPVQWTRQRKFLLVLILACASYYLWKAIYPSTLWMLRLFEPHEGILRIPYMPPQELGWFRTIWPRLENTLLAAAVLIGLWGIAGSRALGFGTPWRTQVIGLGFYMRTGYLFTWLSMGAFGLLLAQLPWLVQATATFEHPGTGTAYAAVYSFVVAATAGLCEEVMVTVLPFWLMLQVRGPRGASSLAITGWGTAIIIALHMSYHTYYGAMMLLSIPSVYFGVIVWKYTRSLLALVVGHMVWDLMMSFTPPSNFTLFLVVMSAVLVGFALDKHPKTKSLSPERP